MPPPRRLTLPSECVALSLSGGPTRQQVPEIQGLKGRGVRGIRTPPHRQSSAVRKCRIGRVCVQNAVDPLPAKPCAASLKNSFSITSHSHRFHLTRCVCQSSFFCMSPTVQSSATCKLRSSLPLTKMCRNNISVRQCLRVQR